MEEKTEGILLHATPYLGNQKILKVFAPEAGLISLMAKKNVPAPFLIAEWVYRKREDLHSLKETTILDPLSDLRKEYETLSAAGQIAKDLLRTQLPSKKGGLLYDLTCAYFKKLPLFLRPETLVASFRLKLLLHEGLLSLEPIHSFTSEEWEKVEMLAHTRQFSQLQTAQTPLSLQEKIRLLFEEQTR